VAIAKPNDHIMAESMSDQFVTAFYGVLDYGSGILIYANAGHNPPYLLRGSNGAQVEPLGRTGKQEGMFEEM
jgi:sigma-B regulation protein RsbU (phosphoserine phosphatase)